MFIGDVLPVPLRDSNGDMIKDGEGNVVAKDGEFYLNVFIPKGQDEVTLVLKKDTKIHLRRPDRYFGNIIEKSKNPEIVARAEKQLANTPGFVRLKVDLVTK